MFPSRFFGLKADLEIFGWLYGFMALGSAVSSLVVAALYWRFGDDGAIFILSGVLSGVLAIRAALFVWRVGPLDPGRHFRGLTLRARSF